MALYARNPFDSGAAGATLITTTSAVTGSFYAIQIIADTLIASLTGNLTISSGSSLTATTFPAGTVLYGGFSSMTLTSGKVVAYQT